MKIFFDGMKIKKIITAALILIFTTSPCLAGWLGGGSDCPPQPPDPDPPPSPCDYRGVG